MNKFTPTQTIRAYCTHCLGLPQFNREEIRNCQGDRAYQGPCPLFPYRLGRRIPVKVFRVFCLEYMGGNRELVRECETESCPVYPYRMGKNPAKRGQGASSEILKKAREQRKSRLESTFRGGSIGDYGL
jgi:hypothetical protein